LEKKKSVEEDVAKSKELIHRLEEEIRKIQKEKADEKE
jgi:hypothetical protein